MFRKRKQVLSVILSVLMLVAFMPSLAFATEDAEQSQSNEVGIKKMYVAANVTALSSDADNQQKYKFVGNPEISGANTFGIYRNSTLSNIAKAFYAVVTNNSKATVKIYETCGLNLTAPSGMISDIVTNQVVSGGREVTIGDDTITAYRLVNNNKTIPVVCIRIVVSEENGSEEEYRVVTAVEDYTDAQIISAIQESFNNRVEIDRLGISGIDDTYDFVSTKSIWNEINTYATNQMKDISSVDEASGLTVDYSLMAEKLREPVNQIKTSIAEIKDAEFISKEASEQLETTDNKEELEATILKAAFDKAKAEHNMAAAGVNVAEIRYEWCNTSEASDALEQIKIIESEKAQEKEKAEIKYNAFVANGQLENLQNNVAELEKKVNDAEAAYNDAEKTAQFDDDNSRVHGRPDDLEAIAKASRETADQAKLDYVQAKAEYDECVAKLDKANADLALAKALESGDPEDQSEADRLVEKAEKSALESKVSKAEASVVQAEMTAAKAEEAKAQAEADKQAAEEAKAQAEADKQAAEEAKAQAEADKQAAEEAKAQAEADKKAAEEAKAQAEADKKAAEDAKAQAEADKEAAEEAKAQAEADKQAAEEAKAQAEADKQAAEEAKTKAEAAQAEAEQKASQAEADKKAAEDAKAQAEADKKSAEEAKAQAEADKEKAEQSLANNIVSVGDVQKITAKVGKGKVTLKWKKAANATGYKIYRATSKSGKYKLVKTVNKGTTLKYVDKKVKKGKKYFYKVQAYYFKSNMMIFGAKSKAVKIKKVK